MLKTVISVIGSEAPVYNLKSTVVACPDTDYVFLYGGYDELDNLDSNVYLLNLKTSQWEIDDKHVGLYREGHLAIYLGDGNVLVFGGVPQDEFPETATGASTYSNFKKDSLMMIYNVMERKWQGPPAQLLLNAPSSRSRHGCCLSEDGTKFYISGGLVNSVPLNDLYEYDLTTGIWSGPIEFTARFDHFITVLDNKLYAMGGLDKDMNHSDRSILYYNFADDTVGSIKIKLNNSTITSITSFSPIDHETAFLDSLINRNVKLKICNTEENDIRGLQLSYTNLVDYDFITIFGHSGLAALLGEDESPYNAYSFHWRKPFVLSNGGFLYILGTQRTISPRESLFGSHLQHQPLNSDGDNENRHSSDQRLKYLLQIPINKLGISRLPYKYSSSSPCGYGKLLDDFTQLLQAGKYTDFEIQMFASEQASLEYSDVPFGLVPSQHIESIGVHKAILAARWPHFQRILESGMFETLTNQMQIPEPSSWVRGFIWYLYTGEMDIENYVKNSDLSTFGGILVLSNLYEMPDLRCDVLTVLNRKLQYFNNTSVDNLIKLWKVLLVANESLLLDRTTYLLKNFWPEVSRCKEFADLPKNLIVKLCQECSGPSFNPLDGFRNSLLTPRSDRISVNSLSDEETPAKIRNNSPFLKQSPISPVRHNSMDPLSSFPTLQSLPDEED